MSETSMDQYIPILMYHSIAEQASVPFRPFVVPPSLFAEQMAYLAQHGYTALTVTHCMQLRALGQLPERPVVLTFDDGFADFHTNALPILQRYSFPATLYVTTGYVGATSRWLRREMEAERPMLTWKQLREIQASGIECGAHTHSHPQLDMLPLDRVRKELTLSKQLLEQQLGEPVSSCAYPYGYNTARVRALTQEAGYRNACAVKFMLSTATTNRYELARLIVRHDTSARRMGQLMRGEGVSTFALFYTQARTRAWRVVRRGAAIKRLLSLENARKNDLSIEGMQSYE